MGQDGVDLSFTDALNLREVERIDKAVQELGGEQLGPESYEANEQGEQERTETRKGAGRSLSKQQLEMIRAGKAETCKRKQDRQEEEPKEEFSKNKKDQKENEKELFFQETIDPKTSRGKAAGFDESEAEDIFEPSEVGEENWLPSDLEQEGSDREGNTKEVGQRRRLQAKTNPAGTGYTLRPLLKRAEYLMKKQLAQRKIRKHQLETKAVRKRAIELMAMQAPPSAFDEQDLEESIIAEHPHQSHRINALHGNNQIIFCKQCGHWSASSRLKLLAKPCSGLKGSNRSDLRLLECGVMPARYAKIPTHLKKVHATRGRRRKSRW